MKEFYLAHPFVRRKEIREWELNFEKRTGIILINPFYDVEREDVKAYDEGIARQRDPPEIVVPRDLEQIQGAKDGLVALINGEVSYGTIQEIVYAKAVFDRDVYSIITNGKHEHPWLVYHSSKIFTALADFEEWVVRS